MSKSGVAPVKRFIKLVAAVLGAKLVNLIRCDLNLTFQAVYFGQMHL